MQGKEVKEVKEVKQVKQVKQEAEGLRVINLAYKNQGVVG